MKDVSIGVPGQRHAYFVQLSMSMDESTANKELHNYYRRAYNRTFDYRAPRFFFEIPTWIPIISGILGTNGWDQHLFILESIDEIHDFAIGKFLPRSYVFISVTDANYGDLISLVEDLDQRITVFAGGYVDAARQSELDELGVIWLEEPGDLVGQFEDADASAPPSYKLFVGWPAIPRLTLSEGCGYNCKFCTVSRVVKERTWNEVMDEAESFQPLSFKYIYLDDKTFGEANNWYWIQDVYTTITRYNPEFEGFIVQTTANEVIRHGMHGTWQRYVKFVEIGVETVDEKWLKWMRKPHSLKQINKAAAICLATGVGLIPNILTCFPGKRYEDEKKWLERWKDTIPFVNLFRLCCYSDSKGKGVDDWFVYTPENADETTFERSWVSPADKKNSERFEVWTAFTFAHRWINVDVPCLKCGGTHGGPFKTEKEAVEFFKRNYLDVAIHDGGIDVLSFNETE